MSELLTQKVMAEVDKWIEPDPESEFVETGNIGFDMAVSNGRGLPLGSSILFWSGPGCGKTTLFADISKRLIKTHKEKGEPFKVLYLAVEGSKELMKSLGLEEYMDSRDFIYVERRFSWSQIELLYEAVLEGKEKYKDVKVIVIDSINNVLSTQKIQNSVASGDYGTQAKERNNFWSKYLPICKEKKISTFMVAQMRQKQNATAFGTQEKAAASFSDLHNADAIFKCVKKTQNKDSEKIITKTAFGETKDLSKYVLMLDPTNELSKNRIAKTYQCELLLEKGVGVHNYYVVRKMLVYHKFLKEASGWYTFNKELVEGFGLTDKKLRFDDVNETIQEHIEDLVAFLKEVGCYSIVASNQIVKTATLGDSSLDNEDNEEETIEVYNEDEDEEDEE